MTLIGLRVTAIGSSEVLLSGLVEKHLSVKYHVPWHGTERPVAVHMTSQTVTS